MPRLLVSFLGSLCLVVLSAGAALAGGSAIVVPDEAGGIGAAVDNPVAGEPVIIGFTLLQHGVAPVTDGSVEVTFRGPDGSTVVSAAEGIGDGRWLATATLPSAGEWSWTVRMPGGLEIVASRDAPSLAVAAAPEPLDAPLFGALMLAGFIGLLAVLTIAARSGARVPEAMAAGQRPAVRQRA